MNDTSTLLGLEGEAAAVYFRALVGLLGPRAREDAQGGMELPTFRFDRRNRRPPTDPVNALLSFAYAMLTLNRRVPGSSPGRSAKIKDLRQGQAGLNPPSHHIATGFCGFRHHLTLSNRRGVGSASGRSPPGTTPQIEDTALVGCRADQGALTEWRRGHIHDEAGTENSHSSLRPSGRVRPAAPCLAPPGCVEQYLAPGRMCSTGGAQ